jgi:Mrp family chromosome partitioning ATPase
MPTKDEVMKALESVVDPELGRNIVDLNMIRELVITDDGKVSLTLALTVPSCPLREKISNDTRETILGVKGVTDVSITMGAMTEEERRAVFGKAQPNLPKLNQFNKVAKVIAVMSGKGGVGKSSVTAMLAVALAKKCQKVGVLDADITGPSIPKLFGLPSGGLRSGPQGMLPPVTSLGIKVMSINLILDNEDTPVIWRGPMISSAITQFWTDVLWGKLDFLLVDLPPGTSDAALTVVQALPINGVILVTSPQQLSAMVVKKASSMLSQLNIPVVGVVENMSYFQPSDSKVKYAIFGPSHSVDVATATSTKVLAQLPIMPEIAEQGDNGQIEQANVELLDKLVDTLLEK